MELITTELQVLIFHRIFLNKIKIILWLICLLLSMQSICYADAYDSFTVFMSHFDGTDGATTADDEDFDGDGAHTLNFQGDGDDAELDTAQKKFGTASLLLDGNDDVTVADSADWDLTGDFVIDLWVYTSTPDAMGGLVGHYENNSTRWNTYTHDTGTGIFKMYSVSPAIDLFSSNHGISSNTWAHVAFVHSGGNYYIYVDGTRVLNESGESDDFPNVTGNLLIGTYYEDGTAGFTGQIDEVRICKGTDRGWTGATITVPSSAYSKTAAASDDKSVFFGTSF